MKRVLFKIIIPTVGIGLWMLTCFYMCNKEAGFDYFLYWIYCGFPFGLRRMWLWLVPKNFGIQGIAVIALNCLLAGVIGGIVLIVHIVQIIIEIVKVSVYLGSGGTVRV